MPISYLQEYLVKGKTLEDFLDDFDGVPGEAALAVLREAFRRLVEGLPQL